jgi:hypothetical protein
MEWVGKDEGRRKRGKSAALASKEKNESEQVGWVIWKSESVQPPGLISTCCGEPGPNPLLAPHQHHGLIMARDSGRRYRYQVVTWSGLSGYQPAQPFECLATSCGCGRYETGIAARQRKSGGTEGELGQARQDQVRWGTRFECVGAGQLNCEHSMGTRSEPPVERTPYIHVVWAASASCTGNRDWGVTSCHRASCCGQHVQNNGPTREPRCDLLLLTGKR